MTHLNSKCGFIKSTSVHSGKLLYHKILITYAEQQKCDSCDFKTIILLPYKYSYYIGYMIYLAIQYVFASWVVSVVITPSLGDCPSRCYPLDVVALATCGWAGKCGRVVEGTLEACPLQCWLCIAPCTMKNICLCVIKISFKNNIK